MICLTVIARNEARCLARCLDSAAPFVDDMLVVDTGSTDATPAIARACGARLARFSWCDDFAAARNFALAQTTAPWRLVLDADEWIEQGGACLRERLADAVAPFVGEVSVRSAFDDGAALRHAPSWIARVLPSGVSFRGRVHEQVVHDLPVHRLPLVAGHDGYRLAQQQGKGDRNERLLRVQLQERPDDPYLLFQLGKDLQVRGHYAAAVAAYAQARQAAGWPPRAGADAATAGTRRGWLHDLVVRHLYCLKRVGAFAAAVEQVRTDDPWWGHSPDFQFTVGDLLLDWALAEPQRAGELLPQMERRWLRCLELGETPHLEGAVEGRGSSLAAHNLAVLHDLTGNRERALHFRALAQRAAAPARD